MSKRPNPNPNERIYGREIPNQKTLTTCPTRYRPLSPIRRISDTQVTNRDSDTKITILRPKAPATEDEECVPSCTVTSDYTQYTPRPSEVIPKKINLTQKYQEVQTSRYPQPEKNTRYVSQQETRSPERTQTEKITTRYIPMQEPARYPQQTLPERTPVSDTKITDYYTAREVQATPRYYQPPEPTRIIRPTPPENRFIPPSSQESCPQILTRFRQRHCSPTEKALACDEPECPYSPFGQQDICPHGTPYYNTPQYEPKYTTPQYEPPQYLPSHMRQHYSQGMSSYPSSLSMYPSEDGISQITTTTTTEIVPRATKEEKTEDASKKKKYKETYQVPRRMKHTPSHPLYNPKGRSKRGSSTSCGVRKKLSLMSPPMSTCGTPYPQNYCSSPPQIIMPYPPYLSDCRSYRDCSRRESLDDKDNFRTFCCRIGCFVLILLILAAAGALTYLYFRNLQYDKVTVKPYVPTPAPAPAPAAAPPKIPRPNEQDSMELPDSMELRIPPIRVTTNIVPKIPPPDMG